MISRPNINPRLILLHLGLILLGALGGLAAQAVGLPLPFILGSLIVVALATQVSELVVRDPQRALLPPGFKFNDTFRAIFIAVIGMTIGTRITTEVLMSLPRAAFSFAALTLFVPLTFWVNYLIFRRVGGYDHPTALFSASPGGLYEAMLFGEQTGADMRQLMLAQFLRIIFVVTLLPIGMSLYVGHPVGSSGGMRFVAEGTGLEHLPVAALVVGLGLYGGFRLHLPAAQLMGPLLLGALVTLSGLAVLDLPNWTLSASQIVIGTTLGTRFTGIRPAMLLRGAWLATLTVGAMLLIGTAMALALHPLSGEAVDVLLTSFAPGGVTEMALIALSLNANPAFVTLHHVYRIILTVFVLTWAARRMDRG
ncbi:monooxygenase [Primorskyibacter flagellatus]|uniref:Monooxygenase n=1 Tax=Primorskyibacter flagellatus TaxID=1387277 RepID=A0A917A423_9RHOB|nr:AbrB family transcriptional regulator [Primorskyibacter flagellatus]GGE25862.1 monooxygenase [Primorskyibacter flagellatus]